MPQCPIAGNATAADISAGSVSNVNYIYRQTCASKYRVLNDRDSVPEVVTN